MSCIMKTGRGLSRRLRGKRHSYRLHRTTSCCTVKITRCARNFPVSKALNIMREAVIAEVSTQLSEVVGVIERHLEPTLLAVHLYGSAVDGGLKPHSDRVGEVTELAQHSAQALQENVNMMDSAADQVNAIATASEEQSAASEEINQAILQVSDMSRQTAESMEQAAQAVSSLSDQAQALTGLIEDLKKA